MRGENEAVITTLSPYGKKVKLGRNMRAALEFAARSPHKWHDIGMGRAAKMAIRRLERVGLVETRQVFNRFRVKHGGIGPDIRSRKSRQQGRC